MLGLGSYDEEEEDEAEPTKHRGQVLRLQHSSRSQQIFKISIKSLEDARHAADMLKERRPVILNLERTEDDVARRAIDFVSGATYALDGYYERVGDKVFLFTPSNTLIASEDDEALAGPQGLYVDGR